MLQFLRLAKWLAAILELDPDGTTILDEHSIRSAYSADPSYLPNKPARFLGPMDYGKLDGRFHYVTSIQTMNAIASTIVNRASMAIVTVEYP